MIAEVFTSLFINIIISISYFQDYQKLEKQVLELQDKFSNVYYEIDELKRLINIKDEEIKTLIDNHYNIN